MEGRNRGGGARDVSASRGGSRWNGLKREAEGNAWRKTASLPLGVLLCLSLATQAGCDDGRRLVQLDSDGFRQDVFEQNAASKLDLLWVIDDSGSMEPHQRRLADGLGSFMAFLDRGGVDYRIAVTTTDARRDGGAFVGAEPVISPSMADPAAVFRKNVRVGVSGSGHEEAFEAARLAVERESASASDVVAARASCLQSCGVDVDCSDRCAERYEPDFMRPDAHLHLIFVSDEDEQSVGELRYFQRFFESSLGLGYEDSVRVAAICGPREGGGCAKAPGNRYLDLVEAMGGVQASICDENFADALDAIALDAAGLKRRFALSNRPLAETLDVRVTYRCDGDSGDMGACEKVVRECDGAAPSFHGVTCVPKAGDADGWTYDARAVAILFHGDSMPGIRSRVVVSYTADPDELSAR